jgi:hypothetical protein
MNDVIIVSPQVSEIHRQKIAYIIEYIVRKYGIGNDIFSRSALGVFMRNVDRMTNEDVEEIFSMIKHTVNK